jgi:AraC-like DNA-binding protein
MQYFAKDHIIPAQGLAFNFGGNWATLHYHDYWEFILITANCTQIINGRKISLRKGNALIVRPLDRHKFVDSETTFCQLNIKITDDNLQSLASSYDKDLYISLKEKKEPIVLELNSPEYDNVYKNVQAALFNRIDPEFSLRLRSSVHLILNNYVTCEYLSINTTKKYSILIQRVIESMSIWQNFSQPLTQLLKEFGFSYMQLYRIFKKETGQSLSEYFLYSKMCHASNLLLNSSDPISSIAQTLGYATQSHFGKAFKDYYGSTPTEYRKNNIQKDPLHVHLRNQEEEALLLAETSQNSESV